MKKVTILLVVCVLLAHDAWSQIIINQGYCGSQGNNLTWTFYSDSTLTINGSGSMANFWDGFGYGDTYPWRNYRSQIKTIIIGDSVNTIEEAAFGNCINLTSVTMSNSLTTIGFQSFVGCSNLTSITLPNSLTIIGGGGCRMRINFCKHSQ